MKFKKGESGNPNGRPKGALDKATKELRERIQLLLEDSIIELQEDINNLSAKDRIHVVLKLLEFVLPKGVQADIKLNSEMTINDFLNMPFNERIELLKEHST